MRLSRVSFKVNLNSINTIYALRFKIVCNRSSTPERREVWRGLSPFTDVLVYVDSHTTIACWPLDYHTSSTVQRWSVGLSEPESLVALGLALQYVVSTIEPTAEAVEPLL